MVLYNLQVRYLYQMVPALNFWRMATVSPPSHGRHAPCCCNVHGGLADWH